MSILDSSRRFDRVEGVLDGRLEGYRKRSEKELDRLEDFFDTALDDIEIDFTLAVPHVGGDRFDRVYLSPLGINNLHETRHAAHLQLVEETVADGNFDAVEDYVGTELEDLDVPTTWNTVMITLAGKLTGDRTESIERRIENGDENALAQKVFFSNAYSDMNPEVFADDSRKNTAVYLATSGVWGAIAASTGMNVLNQLGDIAPESYALGGLSAAASYLLLRDGMDVVTADLTESNLEEYGETDRRRLMLYNSRVADDLYGFLDLMDDYGIT